MLGDNSKNATYLSPTIQKELIFLLAKQLRQDVSSKVSDLLPTEERDDFVFLGVWYIRTSFFSLMSDDTRDVSGNEQLSAVIRVIDADVTVEDHRK